MTDDIVTRIRKQANAGYIDEHEVMLRIAADEIERLRNDIKVRDLQILANFKVLNALHKELYGD